MIYWTLNMTLILITPMETTARKCTGIVIGQTDSELIIIIIVSGLYVFTNNYNHLFIWICVMNDNLYEW